jgi:hypothetical protein
MAHLTFTNVHVDIDYHIAQYKIRESWALVAHTVILAIWEAEIRRITVQGQPREIICKTPISKQTRAK